MQITSARIVNVLSFKDREIKLDRSKLFTAIGPNGSGKTNFIDVLHKVVDRLLIVPVKISDGELWSRKANSTTSGRYNPFAQAHPSYGQLSELEAHLALGTNVESSVSISCRLSDREADNVNWLIANGDDLRSLLGQSGPAEAYTDSSVLALHNVHAIDRELAVVGKRAGSRWSSPAITSAVGFYVKWFRLMRWFSFLSGQYSELSHINWPELGELIVNLGPNRSYTHFSTVATTQRAALEDYVNTAERDLDRNVRQISGDEPVPFDLFRRDIAREVGIASFDTGVPAAIAKTLASRRVTMLSARIREFLDLELKLVPSIPGDPQIKFVFEREGASQEVYRLSSGEKAILQLLFAVYWSGARDVFMMVDEPELHLHPQFHRSFLSIVRSAVNELNWQVLLATHSPGFIAEEFPGSLLCFRKVAGSTEVHQPPLTVADAEFLRLLDYDNSARLLFAKKVVLVEGVTDAFFFAHFLRTVCSKNVPLSKLDEVAFFAIKGKGEREKWTRFLQKLNITVFAISDIDAVVNVNRELLSQLNATKAEAKASAAANAKGSRDGQTLLRASRLLAEGVLAGSPSREDAVMVTSMSERMLARNTDASTISQMAMGSPVYAVKLKQTLESEAGTGHYILSKGELEDYVGVSTKGFDAMANFCRIDFDSWAVAPEHADHVQEIAGILRSILEAHP